MGICADDAGAQAKEERRGPVCRTVLYCRFPLVLLVCRVFERHPDHAELHSKVRGCTLLAGRLVVLANPMSQALLLYITRQCDRLFHDISDCTLHGLT